MTELELRLARFRTMRCYSFRLTDEQAIKLLDHSAARDCSMGEIVRELIDKCLSDDELNLGGDNE